MARTYASAVAGNITSMKFNGDGRDLGEDGDGAFTLSFALNTSITMPTEIFVSSEYYYPNGFNVSVEPKGWFAQSYNETTRVLSLLSGGGEGGVTSPIMGAEVSVEIKCK